MNRFVPLIALVAAAAASPAFACSCLPRTEAQIIAAADVVLAGTVTGLRRSGSPGAGTLTATIRVSRLIKGRAPRQVEVRTRDTSAACGLPLQEGARLRIAARRLNDGLSTNLCLALK